MSILSRVQANPDIGTNHEAYIADLIVRAKHFIISYCQLRRFPELTQGHSLSKDNASTDISSIPTNTFYISVNGSGFQQLSLTLSLCNSGNAIASHMQNVIRANPTYGFNEVSVSFEEETKRYLITSGRYGEHSSINITFIETQEHVCKALCLSRMYGATELSGSEYNEVLETVAVNLVESKYRKLGLEGTSNGSLPGGVSFTVFDLDPFDKSILQSNRKLVR